MGDTVIVETPVDEVVSIVTQGPQGPSGSEAATLTTTGDLLYRDALANDRLPIGSEGQVLKVASGLPAWGNESGSVTSVAGRTGDVTLAVADVANAVSDSDARLTDARTPSTHASTHATGGSDAIAPSDIGLGTTDNVRFDGVTVGDAEEGFIITSGGFTSGVSGFALDAESDAIAAGGGTLTITGDVTINNGALNFSGAGAETDKATTRTTLGLGNSATLDTGTTAGTVAEGDHTHELNALDATGATDGHVLTADGAGGAAFEAIPAVTLNDLSNVSAAAPSDNDVLVYDNATSTWVAEAPAALPIEFVIACSDETSDLTTGTAKVTFRAPVAFLLTGVAASVNTAPTGSTLIVDINNGANSALSTKLSIDASEKTSATAATAAVIDTSYDDFAADAEITIDIDQIGSTVAGKGLKVVLKGTRA